MTRRQPFTVPFTGGEVQVLRQWQTNAWVHPLTCNGGLRHWEHRHDYEVILEVTQAGLVCPDCGRVQDWIPESLRDEPLWRRLDDGQVREP